MTRRQFLRLIAATFGNAIVSACANALPTPTAPAPTRARPTSTLPPSATPTAPPATATPTLTVTPTQTATRAPSPTATRTPRPADFVTVRGDQFFYRGAIFPIRGFNYYPRLHPWRTYNLGAWDANVCEFELRLGARLGANVVRTFVDYHSSLDNTKPQPPFDDAFGPNPQYLAHVREFLDIAGKLGLRVILTLFDGMNWSLYEPRDHWIAERYVDAFVPLFANDPRILCWDLQNEPDRALRQVGRAPVLEFFRRISRRIRALAPHQLQTIGWIDRARAQYFPDLDTDLDFWCFHFYDNAERLPELVRFYKTKTRKPVLLQEFGLPTGGPGYEGKDAEQHQVAYYAQVFRTLAENQMCGSIFWCLNDYPIGLAGNPPIATDSPENHFGVLRLDYSEKPVCAEIRASWKEGL